MKCQTFKDSHLLYIKCDDRLLANVLENFRRACIQHYQLEPSNYISAPGLALDAMLLMTDLELDLVSDLDKLAMIEKMNRGGLCFI